MNTEIGVRRLSMATSGIRGYMPDGPLTAKDIGLGLTRGAGRGSMTTTGDMRRSTMDVGFSSVADGDGFPDREKFGRCMPQRWLRSSVELASGSVAT